MRQTGDSILSGQSKPTHFRRRIQPTGILARRKRCAVTHTFQNTHRHLLHFFYLERQTKQIHTVHRSSVFTNLCEGNSDLPDEADYLVQFLWGPGHQFYSLTRAIVR